MRKIIYWVHTSVDGFIDGPNGEFDWTAMGPDLSAYADEVHDRVDTFLYGRAVWEMMSGYWPTADKESDHPHDLKFASVWRSTPKIVFSRTLRGPLDWDARLIGSDVASAVADLKAEPGKDLLLNGGSAIGGLLASLGLLDEIQVIVHPVVLGGGKPLLPIDRFGLDLVETRTFDKRSVLLSYVPA
ncbi:dihydrofolate reductase family protein [Asanoa sp. WMMD1127]|uniref:dihydrofolate reductase family protein n=1 Tax=Asanoa sp. WMMD1127 TaxID=3016107 RepID=UPI002417859A|nr:dihydrofolate reductase family protein [Asanoa sp. WMMD1127]MDG4820623.1 dihydrofolate reductase family protein [Asanoa sp. WMMD1127]